MNCDNLEWMRKHKLAPKLKYPVPLRLLISSGFMQEMREKLIFGCHKCGGRGILEDVDAEEVVRCECVFRWNYEMGLAAANIPPRYYDIDIDNMDPRWIVENTTISLKLIKMITNFAWYADRGWGFHFVGSPGTGKTAAACALAKALLTQGRTVYYGTLAEVVNKCFRVAKFGTEEDEETLRLWIGEVDLLILDEIDKLANPDHPTVESMLDEYFGIRYNHKRPTVIISKDLHLEFKDNIIGRFQESVTPLNFTLKEDYRVTLAKKRKVDEDKRSES